jgi:hypothetical protein
MNSKIVLTAMGILALCFAAGCGDVCDDAADVCGGERGEGECSGAVEELAQCIVDADKCDAETLAKCSGAPAQ